MNRTSLLLVSWIHCLIFHFQLWIALAPSVLRLAITSFTPMRRIQGYQLLTAPVEVPSEYHFSVNW